jgi:hypothetical protein
MQQSWTLFASPIMDEDLKLKHKTSTTPKQRYHSSTAIQPTTTAGGEDDSIGQLGIASINCRPK